jgi:hypothetical protein
LAAVGWIFPGCEHEPAPASVAAIPLAPRGRATITSGTAKAKAEPVASGVNPLDDDSPFDF